MKYFLFALICSAAMLPMTSAVHKGNDDTSGSGMTLILGQINPASGPVKIAVLRTQDSFRFASLKNPGVLIAGYKLVSYKLSVLHVGAMREMEIQNDDMAGFLRQIVDVQPGDFVQLSNIKICRRGDSSNTLSLPYIGMQVQ